MRILVLGAEGMLGHQVVKSLVGLNVIAPKRNEYNAFDSLDQFNLRRGDVVVNCIGAIPQKGHAFPVMQVLNRDFPEFLAKHEHLMFMQIATDCVFSGQRGNYDENDIRDAEDDYGKTKMQGEIFAPNWMNLRCSIIGPELSGKKSLFEWVRNQPEGATVYGYANHFWNGVTTQAFAEVVRGVIDQEFYLVGTQHLVPADEVSKYELVKMIAEKTGRKDLNIVPKIVDPVNRTLATIHPFVNEYLWEQGRYWIPPTIQQLIQDLDLDA